MKQGRVVGPAPTGALAVGAEHQFSHWDTWLVLVVGAAVPCGAQLSRFADQLAPLAGGLIPDLPDMAALIWALYRLAALESLRLI